MHVLNKRQPYNRRLDISKDRILVLFHNFYLSKKSSILADPFDKYIQIYVEAGLVDAWVHRYAHAIKVRNKFDKRQPKKLHINNVLGAVYIFGMFSLLSVIVFVMELFKGRYPIIASVIDYFTY